MRTMSSVARRLMSSPAMTLVPVRRIMLQSARRVVVVPAPLAPSSAVTPPVAMLKSMSNRARIGP